MIKKIQNWFKKKTRRVSRTKNNYTAKTVASRWSKLKDSFEKEYNQKLQERPHYDSPAQLLEKAQRIMETATLTPEQQKEKLRAIGATSEWSAYYDLQSFPPREAYRENEELFLNVPYFKAGLFLRAEMSVGVGIKDVKDESSKNNEAEIYIKEVFDRLDLEKKLIKTQLHRDLYGNSYWYLDWQINPVTGAKELLDVKVIQPTRVRIRLSRDAGNDVIGYAYLPPILVPGNIPQPVGLEKTDVIHFKGDDYDDLPYGYSKARALLVLLNSRRDINILETVIYKHYTKPWIHWKLNSEGLTDDQIIEYQDDLTTVLQQAGPESDVITTDRWEPNVFSGGQGKNDNIVKTLIDDIDNQMFGELKIPETYFKPKGTTDRMILKQDDNFTKEMIRIQNYMAWLIREELVKPLLESRFGERVIIGTDKDNNPIYNYEIPEIVWNEVIEQNRYDQNKDIRDNLQAGIITVNEARKAEGLPPATASTIQPVTNTPEIPTQQVSSRKQVVEAGDLRLVIEEK